MPLPANAEPVVLKAPAQQEPAATTFFRTYAAAWQRAQDRASGLLSTLPQSVRPLVETQLLVSKLDLQTQILTRVGDVAASTIRRTQQMGGA